MVISNYWCIVHSANDYIIVGATDVADEGVWLWVDGSIVDLEMFYETSFDGSTDSNCAVIPTEGEYIVIALEDVACADADVFYDHICEFNIQATTCGQTTKDVRTDTQIPTDVRTTSSQTNHVTCTRSIANELGKF